MRATHGPILLNRAAGPWPLRANAPQRSALGVDAGMTRLTRLCRAVGVGLAVATATLSMTQVANAAPVPPTVDPALIVDANNKVFLVGHAKGVQKYQCTGTSPDGVWKF